MSLPAAGDGRSAARSVTLVTDIGVLLTHDPAHPLVLGEDSRLSDKVGRGLRDAWIVFGPQGVIATGSGSPPDGVEHRIDAAGRAVIPGFVDSHTHLIFAGDRAAEFTARMAGQPYQAGGIATTIQATRAADDATLRAGLASRVAESRAAGITTREIKSGYAATSDGEARLLRLAGEVTDHTTLLGAHVTPPGTTTDDYVAEVIRDITPAAAAYASRVDVFCETGAFDADQSRAVLEAGIAHGLIPTIHANQLGPGPGVQLAVELGCASADHCTYLSDRDIDALAGSETVATLLPATDFSTRQPYPDGRRLVDGGATVALATNCNPGSSYTTAMSFVIALAVRDCRLTLPEALWAATAGGATALRQPDVGHLRTGARADLVILDAASPDHLAYRPGMPLIAKTIEGGRIVPPPTA